MLPSNRDMTKMNKKAQGLSMNTIIIAAIAMIVLVVIVVIFLGRVKVFGKGVSGCEGTCVKNKADCGYSAPVSATNCDANGDGEPDVEGNGFCCVEVS